MIRGLSTIRRGLDFTWAGPSALAMACRWALGSHLGGGDPHIFTGIATKCILPTRLGVAVGLIAAHTFILTAVFSAGMDLVELSITKRSAEVKLSRSEERRVGK